MAIKKTDDTNYRNIANAIREKNGTENTYLPSEMAEAIENLPSGANLEERTVTPTTSAQEITPHTGYDGLSKVTIAAVTAAIDANIQAENIKKDVVILGVTGTHEGGTTQTLFAPTISITDGTLIITSTNGAFAEGFYIYANGNLLATVQTTTVNLIGVATSGDIITVKAYGTGFNDSAASNSVEFINLPLGVDWATDTWSIIQNTSLQGKTAEIYGSQVGATRTITLTNGNTMTIRLSNATNNMYTLSDGSRTTGLGVEFVDSFPDGYGINPTQTSSGGWNGSQMRTVKMEEIYNLLPADLKTVIATVDIKASSGGGSGQTVVTSQDKLFLLAEREIFATRNGSLQAEWDALTRWQWYADHDTNADRVKKRNGSDNFWWERSAYTDANNWCTVFPNGNAGATGAEKLFGVSPAFCI